MFELMPEDWEPETNQEQWPPPLEEDEYPEPCEECGGRQFVVGGQGHYNGSYQCYTLTLNCENCGPYDVECV